MRSELSAQRASRGPDLRDQTIDPTSCEVMPGHQHSVVDVEDLADSIVALGQLNAVQLIEYPDGRRHIAAGRRRWMACKSRGLSMRADIWMCKANEDVNSENLARAMRVAENTERQEPSAIDVAFQLRRIRNENNFGSAGELGAFMGMSESRVKRYLCVLQASDHLIEAAQSNALSIKIVAELMRCEKQLGERVARKLIKEAGEGTLSAKDLKRVRDKSKRVTKKESTRDFDEKLKSKGNALLAMVGREPRNAAAYVTSLMSQLHELVHGIDSASESSPG